MPNSIKEFPSARCHLPNCLIGFSGFIGSNLLTQHHFDDLYRSTNIGEIEGKEYDLLVCAGVSAVKWRANKFPEEDRTEVDGLYRRLANVRAARVVLISTVDVYPVTRRADESFDCASLPNHPYGSHRLEFEKRLAAHFPQLYIVRLPGVFGPGLKKNVIFDLVHDNCLEAINPESVFQYYDVRGLWADIEVAMNRNLPLVNLVTQPLSTGAIVNEFFPGKAIGAKPNPAAFYDLSTCHASAFGQTGSYRWSSADVLSQLGSYLRSIA